MARARQLGFTVDAEAMRDQSEFTHVYFQAREKQVRVGEGVPGGAYNAGYTLWSLHSDHWKADSVTTDLVKYLQTKQRRDGSWRIRTHRPPLEDSHFTATALSLQALQFYASQKSAEDVQERLTRARTWLLKSKAKTTEDRAFRLLGLTWAKTSDPRIQQYGKELLEKQRQDGGWSQLDTLPSDAYATGQCLYALKVAGLLKPTDKAYERGCQFLLQSQLPDGSWLVTTRSKAFQKYFESKFPHGKSQFISICGPCWATLALLELLTERPGKTQ